MITGVVVFDRVELALVSLDEVELFSLTTEVPLFAAVELFEVELMAVSLDEVLLTSVPLEALVLFTTFVAFKALLAFVVPLVLSTGAVEVIDWSLLPEPTGSVLLELVLLFEAGTMVDAPLLIVEGSTMLQS
jgi:hypothetical protein